MSEPSEQKANVLNLIEQLLAETKELRSENQRLKKNEPPIFKEALGPKIIP
jgi:hypothetical protein